MKTRVFTCILTLAYIFEPNVSLASDLIAQMINAKSRRDLVNTRIQSKEKEKSIELCRLQLSAGLVPVDCEWNKQTATFLSQRCESVAATSEDIEEIKQAIRSKKISSSCKKELKERYRHLSYQRAELNPMGEYEELLSKNRHKM